MSSYSVAEAKNGLPRLIDRAIEGEEVLITRHGRVVAELRPAPASAGPRERGTVSLEWLRARREARPSIAIDSVDVLRELGDEQRW